MRRAAAVTLGLAISLGGGATALPAQSSWGITPMAQGIFVADYSNPIPGGGSLTEARLVQPVIMLLAHGFGTKLSFVGTLDLEGFTMPNGELTPGTWGEGFVDRRHPHTYAHELNVTVNDILGRPDGSGKLSITLGKGFVPFGSDDPMSRPFERYPVNHHLSQIAERAIGIVQYDIGPVTLEGSLFDGDEPTSPTDWPLIRYEGKWRFGDSWSGRATVRPVRGLELQGSAAHVHLPESRPGAGPDADKVFASARWDDMTAHGERYALVEYARTSELDGFFVYHMFLAEGLMSRGRLRLSYRSERTERPEELRLFDPFRTQRPSPDNSILGISRWSLSTLHLAYDIASPQRKFLVQPFVEGTLGYSGTWGNRGVLGNAVKIWSLDANGVPMLADSIIVPNVTTISDVAVTPDGKMLVFTTEGGFGNGLYVYNRADPLHPTLARYYFVAQGEHTREVAVINGRTYVFCARDPAQQQMDIFDITGVVP